MEKLTYTAKEAADVLGVCLTTIRVLCRQPDFPAIRISPRRVVIPVDGLKEWLMLQTWHAGFECSVKDQEEQKEEHP